MKILNYDLCNSCLKLQPAKKNGINMSIEDFLNSKGYMMEGNGFIFLNQTLLIYLEINGGCINCINLVKRAMANTYPYKTPPDILSDIRKKAENNDTEAMMNLIGKLSYDYGAECGTEKNEEFDTEINYWIEKAANLGNAEAQFELACVYIDERDDVTKGIEWLEKSARNGNIKAKHNLANQYFLFPDWNKSIYWMEQASNEGHAGARRKLGLFHYNGIGVPVDEEKGISLIQEAAALGDDVAIEMLKNNDFSL